jgi:hypothetical protein
MLKVWMDFGDGFRQVVLVRSRDSIKFNRTGLCGFLICVLIYK